MEYPLITLSRDAGMFSLRKAYHWSIVSSFEKTEASAIRSFSVLIFYLYYPSNWEMPFTADMSYRSFKLHELQSNLLAKEQLFGNNEVVS